MGWCAEFGASIDAGCGHAMVAGLQSCSCPDCGAQCSGRFAGCADVWAAGPVRRRRQGAEKAATSVAAPSPTGERAGQTVRPADGGDARPTADDRPRRRPVPAEAGGANDVVAERGQPATAPDAEPTDDHRLARFEERLGTLALDVVETLRLLRPLPQAVEAHQREILLLGRKIAELGQELQDMQNLVTQQQARLDTVVVPQASGPAAERLSEIMRRSRPGLAPAHGPDEVPEGKPPVLLARPRPPAPPSSGSDDLGRLAGS